MLCNIWCNIPTPHYTTETDCKVRHVNIRPHTTKHPTKQPNTSYLITSHTEHYTPQHTKQPQTTA